jgi:hypothetical protein
MIDTIKIFIPADQITSFYKTTGSQLLSHNNRIFEDKDPAITKIFMSTITTKGYTFMEVWRNSDTELINGP